MLQRNVTNFMADYGEEFFVCHEIHDAGVNAYRTVCAGECVHFRIPVNLVVEGLVSNVGELAHKVIEPLGIRVCCREHSALGIQLGDVLGHISLDIGLWKRKCLGGICSALEKPLGVYILECGAGNH